MISELLRLPRSAVFAVVDTVGRCFYINYTQSMGQSLARLYDQWGGKTPGRTLDFRVLSVSDDIETLRLHTEYWRTEFVQQGMSELWSDRRPALRYRVRSLVAPNFKTVRVELVTARGNSKVVGIFPTAATAQDFIATYYGSDNPFCFPVYAANSLTKEYLLKRETVGLTIR